MNKHCRRTRKVSLQKVIRQAFLVGFGLIVFVQPAFGQVPNRDVFVEYMLEDPLAYFSAEWLRNLIADELDGAITECTSVNPRFIAACVVVPGKPLELRDPVSEVVDTLVDVRVRPISRWTLGEGGSVSQGFTLSAPVVDPVPQFEHVFLVSLQEDVFTESGYQPTPSGYVNIEVTKLALIDTLHRTQQYAGDPSVVEPLSAP